MKFQRKMLKFPLALSSSPQKVMMPPGSVVRHVGWQRDQIAMWAECASDKGFGDEAKTAAREFVVLPTGGNFPDNANYIGTVGQDAPGDPAAFVWHVIEIITW